MKKEEKAKFWLMIMLLLYIVEHFLSNIVNYVKQGEKNGIKTIIRICGKITEVPEEKEESMRATAVNMAEIYNLAVDATNDGTFDEFMVHLREFNTKK